MNNLVKNGQVINSLTFSLTEGKSSLAQVPDLLKTILANRMWEEFISESENSPQEFPTFEEFVEAPIPSGMGASISELKRLCSHRNDVLTLIDEAIAAPPGRPARSSVSKPSIKSHIKSMELEDEESAVTVVDYVPSEPDEDDKEEDEPDEEEILYNVQDSKYTTAPTGNSKDAGLRRLRNHRPDLHEKVINDEMSIHAACVEAGFRKPPATPLEQAKKAVEKMSSEELKEFKQWIADF